MFERGIDAMLKIGQILALPLAAESHAGQK